MPIYEYRCHTCGKNFEVQAKIADAPPARGRDCVSNKCLLEKQLGVVARGRKSTDSANIERKLQDDTESTRVGPSPHCGAKCGH